MKDSEVNQKEKFKEKVNLLYQEILDTEVINNMTKKLFFVHDNFLEYSIAVNYTIIAYQNYVILTLFKIYDIDQTNQSITLNYLLNSIFSVKMLNNDEKKIKEFSKNTIELINSVESKTKIDTMRNKYYAHLDKKYQYGMKSFSSDEMITFQELNELISTAKNIIKQIYFYVFNLKAEDNELIDTAEKQIDEIIKNIHKGRNIIE